MTIAPALIERSMTEDVPLPDGRLLVRGLYARDPDDAAQLRARHEHYDAAHAARATDQRRGRIGYRTPTGTIWRTRHDQDGELVYDTVRADLEDKARKIALTINTDPGTTIHTTVGVDWALARHIARWIGDRHTRTLDSVERAAHNALLALTWPLLRHHPIPAAPWLATGPETAAGAITIQSLITPGMSIWSLDDARRANECSTDERRDGGCVLTVSEHPTGRIFTVLREGVRSDQGGLHGLKIGHISERQLHYCGDRCLSCPLLHPKLARTLFRRCHRAIGARRPVPLTDDEAVLLQAATLLQEVV